MYPQELDNWMVCNGLYLKSTFKTCSPVLACCGLRNAIPLCPALRWCAHHVKHDLGVCTFALDLDSDSQIPYDIFHPFLFSVYFSRHMSINLVFLSIFFCFLPCHYFSLFTFLFHPFQCASISCTFFLGTQPVSPVSCVYEQSCMANMIQ